jgi:hypothetical protein
MKTKYLENSTQPKLAYAVQECACFSSTLKQSYGEAVKCRQHKKNEGQHNKSYGNSFECCADVSHAQEM